MYGNTSPNEEISNDMVERTIGKLKSKENVIQAGLDLSIVNVAFNVRDKSGEPFLTLGFGANERVEMSTAFQQRIIHAGLSGNKQFAGQTINLVPRLNALAYTEYYVAAAVNMKIPETDISIKPAISLRYLSGQANVYMPNSNSITMYTEPDGRYLDFGLNYQVIQVCLAMILFLFPAAPSIWIGKTFNRGLVKVLGLILAFV